MPVINLIASESNPNKLAEIRSNYDTDLFKPRTQLPIIEWPGQVMKSSGVKGLIHLTAITR